VAHAAPRGGVPSRGRAIVAAMKTWYSTFALIVLVAACGGSPKKAAAPAASPCVAMGAHIVAVSPDAAFGDGDTAAVKAAVQKVMTDHCQADAWAPEAVECMSTATAEAMTACSEKLTPAQRESLTKAMAEEMGAQHKEDESTPAAVEPTDGAKAMDPCSGGE